MDRVYRLIYHEGIILSYKPLPGGYLGYYRRKAGKRPVIMLAQELEHGPRYLRRTTIWEELGHHFALRLTDIYGKWDIAPQQTERSIQERRALRWAADHILTPEDWIAALQLENKTIPILAELWEVTPELTEVILDTHWQPKLSCTCVLCQGVNSKLIGMAMWAVTGRKQ